MTPRSAGLGLALLGAALAVLPFLAWYRIDAGGPSRTRSGVAVAGELWTLPVLAAVIVACALVLIRTQAAPASRPGRWVGAIAAVAGFFTIGVVLTAILSVDASAVPVGVADPPVAPLRNESVAFVAAAAAAAVTAVSLAWLRASLDS